MFCQIVLVSHCIARAGYASMLTTDQTVSSLKEFQDYLSLCRPMLNTYFKTAKLLQCYMNFLPWFASKRYCRSTRDQNSLN
ncbi:MAG: hypothetical protein ACLUOI_32480 [Eisenbergiella sp.]